MTGEVTGRVICTDTQRPARFAEVMLSPVETSTDGRDRMRQRSNGRTDLEGMFTVENVAPGDYYATAMATGYISQAALLMARLGPGGDAQTVLSSLPVVHVSAGASVAVNLTLDRGSVISGRLLWDDGSPAAGVQVNAVTQNAGTQGQARVNLGFIGGMTGFGGMGSSTDDRGQFRLTGLAPGVYLLRASMVAPVAGGSANGFARNVGITLYAPGKVRRADATVITLGPGEERDDVTFQVDLRGLHKVSGRVSAVSGGISIGSGVVRLTDSQDNTLMRIGQIASDGSYVLNYVPAGTYTLTVPSAGPAGATPGGGRGGRSQGDLGGAAVNFQPFQETLTVADGDVGGVNVELTPASK
jgi:hypothetical protein